MSRIYLVYEVIGRETNVKIATQCTFLATESYSHIKHGYIEEWVDERLYRTYERDKNDKLIVKINC